MPAYYECGNCSLYVTVGWLHYHNCDSGYGSRMLLACKNCGTQHAVEIAIKDWGREYDFKHDVIVRAVNKKEKIRLMLMLQRELDLSLTEVKRITNRVPFTIEKSIWESAIPYWQELFKDFNVVLDFPLVGKKLKKNHRPLLPDRLLAKTEPTLLTGKQLNNQYVEISPKAIVNDENRSIIFSKQPCHCCGKAGTLVSEFEDDDNSCPHCKHETLVDINLVT